MLAMLFITATMKLQVFQKENEVRNFILGNNIRNSWRDIEKLKSIHCFRGIFTIFVCYFHNLFYLYSKTNRVNIQFQINLYRMTTDF